MSIFLVLLELVCMVAAAVLGKTERLQYGPLARGRQSFSCYRPFFLSSRQSQAPMRWRTNESAEDRIGIFLIIVNLVVVVGLFASMNHTTADTALLSRDHVLENRSCKATVL
jgi:anaerobic C4-dicarboxylate transporter